jgi:Fis family transcriptional regulator
VTTRTSKTPSKSKSKTKHHGDKQSARQIPLCTMTEEALSSYFATLNGHKPVDLHQLVMGQVERPLLERVLVYTNGNQSAAAEILGLNRGTLRKKLQTYDLL